MFQKILVVTTTILLVVGLALLSMQFHFTSSESISLYVLAFVVGGAGGMTLANMSDKQKKTPAG